MGPLRRKLDELSLVVEAESQDNDEKGMPDEDEAEEIKGYKTSVGRSAGSPAHWHNVYVDEKGDGRTDRKEGHSHRVVNNVVKSEAGHTHELIKPEARKSRGRNSSSNKPASQKRNRMEKPAGLASVTPDVAPPAAPPAAPPPSEPEGSPFEHRNWLDEEYGFVGKTHERVGWPSLNDAYGKYAILRDMLENADHLLDVGCGNGLLYEWLLKEQTKNVVYYGVDKSQTFIAEFVERYPNLAPRLRRGNVLALNEEDLPREHFDVSVAFGVTADFGEGADQYARLRQLVEFMAAHSDMFLIEFLDKFTFKRAKPSEGLVPPSVWTEQRVLEAIGERDIELQVIRPLSKGDFAVIGVSHDVLRR